MLRFIARRMRLSSWCASNSASRCSAPPSARFFGVDCGAVGVLLPLPTVDVGVPPLPPGDPGQWRTTTTPEEEWVWRGRTTCLLAPPLPPLPLLSCRLERSGGLIAARRCWPPPAVASQCMVSELTDSPWSRLPPPTMAGSR